MMADLTQKYVMRLSNELAEEGLAKHLYKQLANKMLAVTRDLKKRCDDHDSELVVGFTMETWPMLVNEYYEKGGTVTQRLQWMFNKRCGNLMTMMFVACKDTVDRDKLPHSSLVADCMMVLHLAQSSIDLYDFIVSKIQSMLGGAMRIIKSNHNEQMRGYAKEMLRLLTRDAKVSEKEGLRIRDLVEKFYKDLTSESLLSAIDDSIADMRNDYGRFVIATLALRVRQHTLSLRDLRFLMARLGTFANTRQFVSELRSLQFDFEADPMDVTDELPISEDATPLLHQFLVLCFDGKRIEVTEEPEAVVRARELRQEARANGGRLPEGSLVQLYRERGTKRAVDELLAAAGPELDASRRAFRKLSVSAYKTKSKQNERNNKTDNGIPGGQLQRHSQILGRARRDWGMAVSGLPL
jgi:hypothetical protein